MKNMYYLYRMNKTECVTQGNDVRFVVNTFNVNYLKPFPKWNIGRKKSNLMWCLISGGFQIFYVDNPDVPGECIHYSYCIPKNLKFPFLKKNEFEIGPSYTDPLFRGMGIYPYVLSAIVEQKKGNVCLYALIDSTNKSSIRSVSKAGFKRVAVVKRTKLLKRYSVVKWLE